MKIGDKILSTSLLYDGVGTIIGFDKKQFYIKECSFSISGLPVTRGLYPGQRVKISSISGVVLKGQRKYLNTIVTLDYLQVSDCWWCIKEDNGTFLWDAKNFTLTDSIEIIVNNIKQELGI